jgi:hypothetical protein
MDRLAEYLPALLIVAGVALIVGVAIMVARTPKAPPRPRTGGGGGEPSPDWAKRRDTVSPKGDGPAAQ